MSTWQDWVRYVRDHCDAPSDVRAFLLYLATYADAEGHCFPAYARLATAMGVAVSTVQRRRRRAVELGWLTLSGGRYRGDPTHYRIVPKGTDGAHLVAQKGTDGAHHRGNGKVPTVAQKGTDEAPRKVPTVGTEGTNNLQEGAVSAPFLEEGAAGSPKGTDRRQLARVIRETRDDLLRKRYRRTFERKFGHLYGRPVAS